MSLEIALAPKLEYVIRGEAQRQKISASEVVQKALLAYFADDLYQLEGQVERPPTNLAGGGPEQQYLKGLSEGLNSLIAAAILDQGFCNLLLTNPVAAMKTAWGGKEPIHLSLEEQVLVLSIDAPSLSNFAMELAERYTQMQKNLGVIGKAHSSSG